MSDINNNININVQSSFSSYGNLMEKLDAVKAKFGEIEEPKGVKRLTKYLEKVADPITTIDRMLDTVSKKIAQLQSKIDITKIQGGSTRELESQLRRYENVQKAIYQFVENNPAIKNQITEQAFAQERQQADFKNAQADLQAFERSLDPVKQKAYELNLALNQAREEFIRLKMAGQDTKSAEKNIKKLKKEIQELEQSTKKTSSQWKVLLGRIKNIAIYRTIRRALQLVFQTVTQGFERVTKLSTEAEQTALRLKADYNLIATAIGSIGYTILSAFIGPIDSATDSLLEFLNTFNKVLAMSLGSDKYFKVVRKGIDGISQATQKLSFDKFEALSKQDESTLGVGLEEVDLTNEKIKNLSNSEQNLYNILVSVKKIFEDIWEVIEDLWNGIIVPILQSGVIKFIIDIVASLITIIDKLKLLQIVIVGLIALKIATTITNVSKAFSALTMTTKTTLGAVMAFLAGFLIVDSLLQSFSGTAKIVVSAIMLIVGAVVAIYTAIQLVKHAWTGFGAIALALGAGGVALAGIKGLISGIQEVNVKGYATGGIPEKSELFVMNENGIPEALVNTGGSQTNVINGPQLAQLTKQGFVEAIYETGLIDAMQNRIIIEGNNVNDNAFARAIFPALKTESRRRGGNQL
jgi:hypothetical protein|nr:MAG TPA: Protein AB21 bisporus, tetrahelical bundle, toxin-like.5A [Caudoviricetes sp.]